MDRKQLRVVEDGASKMIRLFLRPSCANVKSRVDVGNPDVVQKRVSARPHSHAQAARLGSER